MENPKNEMNHGDLDQIAVQAADKLHGVRKRDNPATEALRQKTIAIIKAACEKAYRHGWQVGRDFAIEGQRDLLRGKAQAVTPAPDSREPQLPANGLSASRAAQASEGLPPVDYHWNEKLSKWEPAHASDGGVCPNCGTMWVNHGETCK